MDAQKNIMRLDIENNKHLSAKKHTVISEHPLHRHSFFEIEIILSGSGSYTINDIAYDISEHNIFFLTPNDYHSLETTEKTELLNISFDEKMVDEQLIITLISSETEKAYKVDRDKYIRLVKAAELLDYECTTDGKCQKNLLYYLLNHIFDDTHTLQTEALSDNRYSGIKNALIYMQTHFKEPISLTTLAECAGYHPTYFSELFKKTTGTSYTKALNRIRLSYSKTLLSNGFSVSESCFLSGFGSLSNFGSNFKKEYRISPYDYAKNFRK